MEKYKHSTILENSENLEKSQEYHEKLTIILSIKVTEMMKKINLLVSGMDMGEDDHIINLVTIF